MTAIPLLYGVTADERAEFVKTIPLNLEPVVSETGLAHGYLRNAMGATTLSTGPGLNRGGIVWNGMLYRVMGSKLVSVAANGSIMTLGDVGNDGNPVALDFGFGRLAIGSAGSLFYWDGTNLTQVTDPDLGIVVDMIWITGYFASTDGTSIVVTDLADPTSVNPLKDDSAEEDPDPIVGLFKLRGELYALGTETIQVFSNVGGSLFPFQAETGATIPIGCCGTNAKTAFIQSFAFVGSARNEGPRVFVAGSGTAEPISTRFIDDALAEVADPSKIRLEARVSRSEQRLYVHLPDRSFVFLASASKKEGEPIWYEVASGIAGDEPYRIRDAIFAYNRWICGDLNTPQLGTIDFDATSHFGEEAGWRLDTSLIYNQGNGGIVHSLEMVGPSGRGDGTGFLSFSEDGDTYGMEKAGSVNRRGDRLKRVQWRPHKRFGRFIGARFRGYGLLGITVLEAQIEPLNT